VPSARQIRVHFAGNPGGFKGGNFLEVPGGKKHESTQGVMMKLPTQTAFARFC